MTTLQLVPSISMTFEEQEPCLLLCGSADEARLDEAKAALDHVVASRELFGAPLLIIANKQVHPLLATFFKALICSTSQAVPIHKRPKTLC
jgi:hypothetical protein